MADPSPKTDGRETRVNVTRLEVRSAGGDAEGRTVTGYAAVFDSETDICGCWVETIAPGAFTRSLRENDVVALYSHDMGRVIGRSSAKTLRIDEDAKGLKVEIDLPDTTDGRDIAVLVERGDITGMSFGFCTRKQEWDETVEPPKRTILDVDLVEVTITAFPQYTDTEIGLRSLEGARSERRQHNKAGAQTRLAERRARQAQAERGIR
ncbi:MAG TPA: HK97 family phage prohead protease [Allosphingosinicella sp.]